jgi:excisionase family DNA binding protein
MMADRPFSPKQLAERWGCTTQHVHNLIRKEVLASFRIGEKLLRVPAEEVARWEALQKKPKTTSSESSTEDESSPRGKGRTIEDAAFASAMASLRRREPPN